MIEVLKKRNLHERDRFVSEHENYADNHIYLIRGRDHTDMGFKSVTTYLKDYFEGFNPDSIIDKYFNNWQKNTRSPYFNKTKDEIKRLWLKRGADASKLGTEMHEDIERYFNLGTTISNTPEIKMFNKWIRFNGDKITPYRTEMTVFSGKYKLVGNIDFITKNDDGTFNLFDWKRVKDIRKGLTFSQKGRSNFINYLDQDQYGNDSSDLFKYRLQLNIYKIILEDHYGMEIKNMYNVVLQGDNQVKTYKQDDMSFELREILKNEK